MGRLKYKTRGNANPQGKAKVYFSCHEDDFETYFHSISEEILENQNCAIWYDDNFETKHDEEFYEDLKQMQLFVMPITTNLLSTENRALDEEFLFAEENHIPVLPLMQESGLEGLFNEKCGTLQFLEKFSSDYTAISYDEKLKKYLSTVLIGDELAEKIRAAFDAYIFMSYRKIDRAHAQKLMRLIHDNEMCRDIAVWYDEMLVPGEEFNDAIKVALQKSELFVMAVTPNLLEKDNYIMREEYPIAKENGKIIFPAEMIKTNADELRKNYIDIPECADTNDSTAFAEALISVVKKIAIKENDRTPEHNFFIGLAYLHGIDVEVDYVRALNLMKSAAEEGVIEAIEQLIIMYETGKGVVRNYEKAYLYRSKKQDYYFNKYINGLTDYVQQGVSAEISHILQAMDFEQLLWCMIESGDAQLYLGYTLLAKNEYYSAKKWYKAGSDMFKGWAIKKAGCRIEHSLGNILMAEGNLKEAEESFKNALRIIEEIGEEAEIRDLKICYAHLGNLYIAKGDLENARIWLEKGMICSQKLKNVDSELEIMSYSNLGRLFSLEGKLEEAEETVAKCLEWAKKIVEESKTTKAFQTLMRNYLGLGNIYLLKRDLKNAKECFVESMRLAETIFEERKNKEASYDLCVTYTTLANLCIEENDTEQAKQWYQKSLLVIEKTGGINEKKGARFYAGSCVALGALYDDEANREKAREYYEKCFRILSENELSEDIEKLSAYRERLNQINSEENISEQKVIGTPIERAHNLANDCELKGMEREALGNWEEAIKFYEKSASIREELIEDVGTVKMYEELSATYKKLLKCYEIIDSEELVLQVKEKYQLIETFLKL